MCGLVGAFDLRENRVFDVMTLRKMIKAIRHRGPDEEDCVVEPGIAMGACRLAIRDIKYGQQPLWNIEKNVVVAFNGEIYNNELLRDILQQKKYHFRTRCDTETWLYLYQEAGEQLFDLVKGQFGLSLWDKSKATLLLARDRTGISPLFYIEQDGWLIWSSEIKGLLASGLIRPEPDYIGIDTIIQTMTSIGSRTVFKNVHSLLPGHYLQISKSSKKLVKYWDLNFPWNGEEKTGTSKILIEQFDSLLQMATKRRMVGDVEIASYLSGGVDSSTILAIADKANNKVQAFTIQLLSDVGIDELSQAQATAKYLGSEINWISISKQTILNCYPELIKATEFPVFDTSCASLLELAKLVRKHQFKVVLSGEGADEALAGYSWFKYQKIFNIISHISSIPFKQLQRYVLMSIQKDLSTLAPFNALNGVRIAQQNVFEILGSSRTLYYSPLMKAETTTHNLYLDKSFMHPDFSKWHPLNQSLYIGYKTLLAGHLMIGKGDRLLMNSSVEGRYPFLDEDVIDFCCQLAPKYKLRFLTEKWLLRQVAKAYLPKQTANRPKGMFSAKRASLFLNASTSNWVDELLSPTSLEKTNYFNSKGVAFLIKQLHGINEKSITNNYKQLSYSHGLTAVIATQLWHHTFFGGGLCSLPYWRAP